MYCPPWVSKPLPAVPLDHPIPKHIHRGDTQEGLTELGQKHHRERTCGSQRGTEVGTTPREPWESPRQGSRGLSGSLWVPQIQGRPAGQWEKVVGKERRGEVTKLRGHPAYEVTFE